MDAGAPLPDARLRACLAPWLGEDAPPDGVVLAVSGGPDSTVLMGASTLCARAPRLVVTVDHGLRPASAGEAEAVAALARSLGLPHRTLAWTGPKPATGIQAAARAARYGLLARAAHEVGASRILTAHTLDDQAETVLMRLLAGSDLPGLAGMRGETSRDGVVIARPFLGVAKARLVATCWARGWPFAEDPGNADPRFGRARLRALMPALAAEGLSARRLATLAARAARTEAALATQAEAAWTALRVGQQGEEGDALDGHGLAELPEAVALRVVARLLAGSVPDAQGPRLERLERLVLAELLPALREGRPLRRSLGGALLTATPRGRLRVEAAPPRRPRG